MLVCLGVYTVNIFVWEKSRFTEFFCTRQQTLDEVQNWVVQVKRRRTLGEGFDIFISNS